MKKGGLLLGLNLVLSLLALAVGGAAIALYWLDPRGTPEPEIAPATPVEDGEPAPPPTLGDGPVATADVVAVCLPAVVNISTTRTVQAGGPGGNPFFDLLRPFLGDPGPQEAQSLGSGVIVDAEGVVLTNHHVVADASEIRVTLADGRELPARAVGSDPESDVAVLRLEAPEGQRLDGLTALSYGDSSALRQGDRVLAIGNPFGVGQTVTMGIVSATGRAAMGITDYEDFIQTDAAINPGNSGGALVNLRGELVGINTAILSRTGGSHGIGFAIPSNMARPLAEALLRDGHVTRGWLGVAIQDLTPQLARSLGVPATRGVVIMDIEPTGPAATVDLRRGDVVTGLDSETIRSSRQFRNLIATRGAGAEVRIRRERQGQAGEVQVTLRPRPAVQAGPPGTPSPGQPAPANATDVGGMLLAPLTDALRSQYGVSPQVAGSVVVGLRDGSPAASVGLRVGDVVTDINGQPATDPARAEQLYASSFLVAMVGVRRGVDQRIVMLRR